MNVYNNFFAPFKIAKVAVEDTAYYFDKLYDYIVPVELEDKVFIGQRILVPFGKGNRKKIGLILNVEAYTEEKLSLLTQKDLIIKPINAIIDNKKIINIEMIKLILWLKKNTFCRYFDAIKVIIPSGYNITVSAKYKLTRKLDEQTYNSLDEQEKLLIDILKLQAKDKNNKFNNLIVENLTKSQQQSLKHLIDKGLICEKDVFKRKIQDQKLVMVKLNDEFNSLNNDIYSNYKFTVKQKEVINFLINSESASVKEVLYICGVTKSVLDNLAKKEVITYFEIEVYRNPYELKKEKLEKEINLNVEQKEILDRLIILINQDKPNIALLRGVTGSGKTLIFISLIKHIISKGKKVIFLVPEISLTPQMINNLESHFGSLVAVLHSGLTLSNRLDEWKRIKNGEAKIVLGTRSAIFAPLGDIGLIIMDEEQEVSYKSENSPRYHAREICKLRAVYNKALFLMASATPSIETYYYMKKNKFDILELDKRHNNISLPQISIVDMMKEKKDGNNSFFSKQLILSIEANLLKGEQSIIFINRRGYNTIIKCDECGFVETCPNCSIALTYHKTNNRLICHYCGYSKNTIKNCSNCGSCYLRYVGIGTQKIELQLETIFPQSKILRLDSDTTMTRFSYDRYFKDFLEQKYDILIGTQMIAKGLNFPNVTLVGVIDADQSIYNGDYKSLERTYDIITQVIGRSGRGDIEGKAIIQTNSIDNNVFELIANHKYQDFYNQEILVRKKLFYPPYCDLSIFRIIGENEGKVIEIGNELFNLIKILVSEKYQDVKLKVYGPIAEDISKINNKYRYKIFLKHKNNKRFREMVDVILKNFSQGQQKRGVNIFIDKI